MIIDGRQIAADILARAKSRAAKLAHPPIVAAIVASDTPATRSYLTIKGRRAMDAGCVLDVRTFPQTVPGSELDAAATGSDADALIVQLPLPEGIDAQAVCDAIPLGKDADVLSTAARKGFERGDTGALLPPVVAAIAEIFKKYNVEPRGKRAVIIGRGWLVGEPAAAWLMQQGARVTTLNRGAKLGQELQEADIIVCGAGAPHLVKPYMIKDDVVLIDAGTSESDGALAGDADPECATKCSLFTPVPGGVGPIAVACLFDNAVTLAERSTRPIRG
jgi:methylenetetrahydrofolate dehydrogenase (NADP+)/methenyltetrahydrofolate cyclohydrolase